MLEYAAILRHTASGTHRQADTARATHDTTSPLYDHGLRKGRLLALLAAEYEQAADELESLARAELTA